MRRPSPDIGILACAILALAACPLFAEDSEKADSEKAVQQNLTAQTGISKGSFNPGKHGISLPPKPKVMIIPIDDKESTREGMIDYWQEHFLERRLRRAKDEKFDLVILEINTNGGLVDACRRINKA